MTTTLSAQAQFNRAYTILKSLHGEVALMLQNMDELSAELEEDPEYIISQIREASESRPGLELLLDPSKLTVLDTFEDKTALVMAALRPSRIRKQSRFTLSLPDRRKRLSRLMMGMSPK